jgi:hypothetical protein
VYVHVGMAIEEAESNASDGKSRSCFSISRAAGLLLLLLLGSGSEGLPHSIYVDGWMDDLQTAFESIGRFA